MQPDLIGGRYRVRSPIGRGGMGTVWLCRDEKLQRDVAVKQVGRLPGESMTDSARALREARSSAALSHRNVVTVFDVVEESDAIWLVMEYVPSRSLSEIIREDGPLDPAVVAQIGAQIADGLAAAHALGTVHRDVKPGNVLIREDGVPKISDFGIARNAADPALTQSGFVTGTPSYFSPELATGHAPSPAADVWALGATLYAAVEGHPPYKPRENPVAVLHDIATQQPPRPQHAGFLEQPLRRMLDRDPRSRWSMADAAHSLHRLARLHASERTRENTVAFARTPPAAAAGSLATRSVDEDHESSVTGSVPPPTVRPVPPPDDEDRSRRRGLWYALLAVAALLVIIGGIAFAASLRDDTNPPSAAENTPSSTPKSQAPSSTPSSSASRSPSPSPSNSPSTSPSTSPSPSPSKSPTKPSASASPSSSASTQPSGGSSAKTSFLRDYFATAPGGTDAGWAMLTPSYQAQVGRASYNGFWRTIRSVDVSNVSPEGGNSVLATLTYTSNGGSTSVERHRLDLVPSGDGYLINGDSQA
ncbi:MAG: serine/threonine-protein kinase [Nocardioidaceae bacterium]